MNTTKKSVSPSSCAANSPVVSMPLKEITDLLSVRHYDAMNIVKKMSKNQSFGSTTKISLLIKVGKGAEKTIKTYLLNRRQSIAVAARLDVDQLMRIIDRLDELEGNVHAINIKNLEEEKTKTFMAKEAHQRMVNAFHTLRKEMELKIAKGIEEGLKAEQENQYQDGMEVIGRVSGLIHEFRTLSDETTLTLSYILSNNFNPYLDAIEKNLTSARAANNRFEDILINGDPCSNAPLAQLPTDSADAELPTSNYAPLDTDYTIRVQKGTFGGKLRYRAKIVGIPTLEDYEVFSNDDPNEAQDKAHKVLEQTIRSIATGSVIRLIKESGIKGITRSELAKNCTYFNELTDYGKTSVLNALKAKGSIRYAYTIYGKKAWCFVTHQPYAAGNNEPATVK